MITCPAPMKTAPSFVLIQQLQLQGILTYFGGQHSPEFKLLVHTVPLSLELIPFFLKCLDLF